MCLIIYWHRSTSHFKDMLQASTDIAFQFRSIGKGSSFLVAKFGGASMCCQT